MNNKEIKFELNVLSKELYENLPTGEVDTFDLIKIIKEHKQKLDIIIDSIE